MAEHIAPLMKAAGFHKASMTFDRRCGDVSQFVNVQFSSGGTGEFYVNVGVLFDAVTALGSTEMRGMVGKHAVHYGLRLEELVTDAPQLWSLDDPRAGERLRTGFEQAITWLDKIDSAPAMLANHALDRGFAKVLRAQLKWITGDRGGAGVDLESVVKEFSDRPNITPAKLAARAGIR